MLAAADVGGGAIEIRRVRRGDEQLLRDVRMRALTDAPAAFASTVQHEAGYPETHWAELVAESERALAMVVFAALAEQQWLGMAAGRWFDRERGVAQLWGMWVAPEARRLGIGARLVGEVDGWARSHDARRLRLGVVDGLEAEAFYERLGFARTGETRPLPRDESKTAVFLDRPLAGTAG